MANKILDKPMGVELYEKKNESQFGYRTEYLVIYLGKF